MIAQQLLRLVQELAFVLRSRGFITTPQLSQNLHSCRFTHCFIHSGHGNPTFGATYPFTPLSTPSPGNNTFGAIRRGESLSTFPKNGLAPRQNWSIIKTLF